jgi:ligand-binding sensor domain-containing protein
LLSYNVSALLYADDLLWVGTDNGLATYDGSDWTVYTTNEGLPNNQIYVLSEDPNNGDILIGTDGGGAIFDGETFFTIPTGPEDGVYGIVTRGDGDYWLTGGGGLWRYNLEGGDTENWDPNNSAIPSYTLYESVVAEDGTIFVGSDYGLLSFQEAPDFALWLVPNVPSVGSFDGILTEPNGNLWAQGRYGSSVDLFDVASEQWVDGWAMGDRPGYPLLIEPDGTIWANNGTSVLLVYGPDGSETEIGEAQGMPVEAFVYGVRIAPDGTAWLITSNGLLATDGQRRV